jgi:hypothetical protein
MFLIFFDLYAPDVFIINIIPLELLAVYKLFRIFHWMMIHTYHLWGGIHGLTMKHTIIYIEECLPMRWILHSKTKCCTKLCSYLDLIYCFSPELLLNVPTPRNHIHVMNELMDPLGMRNILGNPSTLAILNVLLRVFNSLISIFQLKVGDWLVPYFNHFSHFHLVL